MSQSWKPQFKQNDVTILKEKLAYPGYCKVKQLDLQYAMFQGGKTHSIQRDLICRPPSISVLLVAPASEKVVMLEQFRLGAYGQLDSPWLLEIVAGVVDGNDTLSAEDNIIDTVYREIKEETGCEVLSLLPICNYLMSPGISNEYMHVFCAKVKAPSSGEIHGLSEEGEDIKIHVISMEDVFQCLAEGQIVSSPAVIAVQWLKLNRASLHFPQ